MSNNTELVERWGTLGWKVFGWIILEAGAGGGYVTIPYVLDEYERALGLEPRETWLIKRLLRNYWQAGDDVFPSFKEIASQANITEPTLRKLRDGLIKKGLIRSTGKKGRTNGLPDNRNKLDITPVFFALAICILSDPASKYVKSENRKDVREEFSKHMGNDPADYVSRFFQDVSFPITIKNAQELTAKHGISLAWDVIAKMQGAAELQKAEVDNGRYFRQLEIKNAMHEAVKDEDGDVLIAIRWDYKQAYKLLQRLVDSSLTPEDVYRRVREYVISWDRGTFKHTFQRLEHYLDWSIADASKVLEEAPI